MGDMVKGNIAMAEAAIRAGMHMYAGYPITPSTEIMEYMSWRAPEAGRQFIQAESELGAMYMVYGAAAIGARVLTASSGLGISLKQEGVSYMNAANYPCVMIIVCRYGDGLGSLASGQTDYLRETRGGGNGDYRNIVLSPCSVQEAVDLVYLAFDLSEKYRSVVVVYTEGALGQMMEDCEYPPMKEVPFYDWAIDGKFTQGPEPSLMAVDLRAKGDKNNEKRAKIIANEQRWEAVGTEDADYVFFSFGLPGRVTLGLVNELRKAGQKVGVIRPISLWPFPQKAYDSVNKNVKAFITVETNDEGQMIEDVALFAKKKGFGKVPCYVIASPPGVPKTSFVKEKFEEIKNGEAKEVY
jgi:2-oxoglutarate ferredoxin oxidoreductase subunit alpha